MASQADDVRRVEVVTADRDQALGFNFCAQIAAWMRSGGALLGFLIRRCLPG
jgi:hypothetical protein